GIAGQARSRHQALDIVIGPIRGGRDAAGILKRADDLPVAVVAKLDDLIERIERVAQLALAVIDVADAAISRGRAAADGGGRSLAGGDLIESPGRPHAHRSR